MIEGCNLASGKLAPWEVAYRAQELGRQLCAMRLLSGQRIRNLRIVLGWSQREAALHLGVSRRTIIRHEQGRNRHNQLCRFRQRRPLFDLDPYSHHPSRKRQPSFEHSYRLKR